MKHTVERIQLANNYSISRILKGGWQLASDHSNGLDGNNAIADMFTFVDAGITTFDFGDIYTGVEELIGQFRKEYKKKYATTPPIQLHTKFVPDRSVLATIDEAYVEHIIDRSLKRLGVEQLNLVQFHWWDFDIPRYVETAHYLKKMQDKGKIQYLGLTNFDSPRLKELLDSGLQFLTHQIQYSVLDQRPEIGMVELCQKEGIHILCYGTVAGGFLSEKYLGQKEPKEPYENRSLIKYKLIIDDFGGWDIFQTLLKTLETIARKYGVSITNVATRYILQKPQVAGVIIGARNANHVENNTEVFSFTLTEQDIAAIDTVINQSKGPKGDIYGLERIKGGKHAGIMKYNLNKE